MRLLKCGDIGALSLIKFFGDDIPPYTILSHTWTGDEEVTFKELMDGDGKGKAGYQKILFCEKQSAQDKYGYFWVDTCCINKSSEPELSEAINSMFRWYSNAAKCYVYMSDVSRPALGTDGQDNQLSWESAFRKSRWFTRGWTLQELIAPKSVEFFSKEGEYLGNKESLAQIICEITGIPIKALQGADLRHFSVTERFSWAEKRETTLEEDAAYALLGIFGIHMPLIYGEGRKQASVRLRRKIEKALKGKLLSPFS